jgi:predicted DNA-binding transcriptional regulator AlpA
MAATNHKRKRKSRKHKRNDNHNRWREQRRKQRNPFKLLPRAGQSFPKAVPLPEDVARFATKNSAPVVTFVQGEDQVPRRLLTKREMLARVRVTYPTIWEWMRAGKFPRARIVGNKSMWFESEVDAWIDALPEPTLKGDKAAAEA